MAADRAAMIIRIAANLTELKANLAEGKNQIETTTQAMQKLATSFQGDRLIQSAHNVVAAVHQIGGASKLTEAEMARVNSTLTRAIEKYTVLGKEAPQAMRDLAEQTRRTQTPGQQLNDWLGKANNLLGLFGAAISAGAIVSFGRQVLEAGDRIQKMADQTGLSTDEVQKLEYVAKQSGTAMTSLVSAMQNVQQRLGSGDEGMLGGLRRLNINLFEFKQLSAYEQMTLLADRVRDIKDPTEQAAIAAELFGRNWKEILPAIKAGMKELGEEAPRMSKEAVAALDKVGDALSRKVGHMVVFAAESYRVLQSINTLGGTFKDYNEVLKEERDAMKKATDTAKEFHADGLKPLEDRLFPIAEATRYLTEETNRQKKAADEAAKAAKKLADETRAWHDSVQRATIAANLSVFALNRLGTTLPNVTSSVGESFESFRDWVPELEGATGNVEDLQREGRFLAAALVTLKDTLIPMPGLMSDFGDETGDAGEKAKKMVDSVDLVVAGFARLSQIKGGLGEIGEAAGSVFGAVKLIDVSLEGFAGKDWQGKTAGLVAAFAAISEAADQANAAVGITASVVTGAIAGGPAGAATGAVIGTYNAFQSNEQSDDDAKARLKQFVSGFANDTTIGSADRMREGMAELRRLADEAGISLKALFTAHNAEELNEALEEVNRGLGVHQMSMDAVNEAAEKYGLTIEEMGTKWAAQELDKKAQGLYQDWMLLTGAGADVAAVATKMGPAVSDFVNQSIRAGVEIPASMKPIIDEMLAQGSLLDENGNKFASAEEAGITYSETMTQGFTRVVDVVERMIEAIGRALGITIEANDQTQQSNQQTAQSFQNTADTIENSAQQAADTMTTVFTGEVPDALDVAWTELQRTFGDDMVTMVDASTSAVSEKFSQTFEGEVVGAIGRSVEQLDLLRMQIETLPDGEFEIHASFGGMPDMTITPMADGGMGTVTKPTLFLAGEAGREEFAFSGAGKSFGGQSIDVSGIERKLDRLLRLIPDEVGRAVGFHVAVGRRR